MSICKSIIAVLILVTGALISGYAQPASQSASLPSADLKCGKIPDARTLDTLASGTAVTRDIAPPQVHWYKAILVSEHFARITVNQLSTDLLITVCNSEKRQTVYEEFARESLFSVPVSLLSRQGDAESDSPGTYFLRIEADPSDKKGQYQIQLLQDRVATEMDAVRFDAERSFMEANLHRDGPALEKREAIRGYSNALSGYRKLSTADDYSLRIEGLRGEAFSRGFLAYCLSGLHQYQEAMKYQSGLPQLWHSLQDLEPDRMQEDKAGEAQALNNLAFHESFLGRLDAAIRHFNEALPLQPDDYERALTLNNLAKVLLDVGRTGEAINTYNRALAMLDKIHHPDADALSVKLVVIKGLGIAQYDSGQYRAAARSFERALTIPGITATQRGEIINSTAAILTKSAHSQDLAQVESKVREAKKLWEASGYQLGEAIASNNLGRLYEQRKNLTKAIELYKSALNTIDRLTKEYGNNPDLLLHQVVLFNLAHAQQSAHLYGDANLSLGKAIEILENASGGFSDDEYRQAYFAARPDFYELRIATLMELARSSPQSGYEAQALQASEKMRSRRLIDIIKRSRVDISPNIPQNLSDGLNKAQQQLAASRGLWKQLLQGQHTAEERRKAQDRLSRSEAEYNARLKELSERDPHYSSFFYPKSLSISQIQDLIADDDTAIVEYSLGDTSSYVWVISKAGFLGKSLPISRASVDKLMHYFRDNLTERNCQPKFDAPDERERRIRAADARYRYMARRLSSVLLDPIAGQIQGRRIVVVADGPLQKLPFAALPDPDGPSGQVRLLLQKHVVSYLPSITVLAISRELIAAQTQASRDVSIFADGRPAASAPKSVLASDDIPLGILAQHTREGKSGSRGQACPQKMDVLAPLRGATEEAEFIANIAEKSGRSATVDDASFAAVLKPAVEHSQVLHFATHAFAPGNEPERSGIVLSREESGGRLSIGYFGLAEIYKMKLHSSLVVLSACDTGLGQDLRGEGMVSLARAFMYAGSPRVVASLWKVDDKATASLMREFYDGMFSQGMSPADALRQAQLAIQRSKEEPKWRSPFYWAGFILEGDWTPLPQ